MGGVRTPWTLLNTPLFMAEYNIMALHRWRFKLISCNFAYATPNSINKCLPIPNPKTRPSVHPVVWVVSAPWYRVVVMVVGRVAKLVQGSAPAGSHRILGICCSVCSGWYTCSCGWWGSEHLAQYRDLDPMGWSVASTVVTAVGPHWYGAQYHKCWQCSLGADPTVGQRKLVTVSDGVAVVLVIVGSHVESTLAQYVTNTWLTDWLAVELCCGQRRWLSSRSGLVRVTCCSRTSWSHTVHSSSEWNYQWRQIRSCSSGWWSVAVAPGCLFLKNEREKIT